MRSKISVSFMPLDLNTILKCLSNPLGCVFVNFTSNDNIVRSIHLLPRLSSVEGTPVPSYLQGAILCPKFAPINSSILGIQNTPMRILIGVFFHVFNDLHSNDFLSKTRVIFWTFLTYRIGIFGCKYP